jgi:hypothetical protein
MKEWLFFLCYIVSFGGAAQTESTDAPVFISRDIDDISYGSFSISTSYYTINNNIDNRQSSAFISDTPSPEEYLHFAQHQPSYCFLIHRQRSVLAMVLFHPRHKATGPDFAYIIVNPASGHRREVPSRLVGQLTEKRAEEMITHQLLPAANQPNDTLFQLGETSYSVLSFAQVRQEVATLARHFLRIEQGKTNELEGYIRTETVGGTLDFATALAREPQQRFFRHGVVYDKARFSVLLWGGAVRLLGLHSLESARTIWEDIRQRPLTPQEWQALRTGFQEQKQRERP